LSAIGAARSGAEDYGWHMCSNPGSALDRLAGENVVAMTGPELRGQVLGLLAAVNRLQAELRRRVGEFDPATGRPLDVGRTHRLVPHWLRKALHARDRRCRFPGCQAPVAWTGAHHLTPGRREARPRWTTSCCCAASTTVWCTSVAGRSPWMSGTGSLRRPDRIGGPTRSSRPRPGMQGGRPTLYPTTEERSVLPRATVRATVRSVPSGCRRMLAAPGFFRSKDSSDPSAFDPSATAGYSSMA